MYYNILLDKLPQYTPARLKIRTDFRECIKFELLMQDNTIEEEKKVELALKLFYFDDINDIEEALKDIIWFYSCGKKENEIKETKQNKKEIQQIYSYEFDDNHIYTAFKTQYNIDLNSIKYLHWWKFKSMFEDLREDNKIVEIMGYRSCDLSKIKDKEEKSRIKRMKKIYALPDMRTREQKEADFGSAFW